MFNPREAFFLQWHITDRCNLACRHCYREAAVADLPLAELRKIFENFLAFRANLPQAKARVQLAGGEPLLAAHLLPVLELIAAAGLQSRILTNGTLVDRRLAGELKRRGCAIVQISLDGALRTHDAIRGAGSFARALEGAALLREQEIQVTFAMTICRHNVGDIPAVLEIAAHHADRVGFHRLVPCGRARDLASQLLTPDELKAAFELIWHFKQAHPELDIPLRDPLWKPFFGCCDQSAAVDGCSAAYAGLCINADGTVYPCRRLPVALGNAQTDRLQDLWQSPYMHQLRNRALLGGRCGKCQLQWRCGGCRAIPYALRGEMLGADPQCFYSPSRTERILRRTIQFLNAKIAPQQLDGG